MNIYPNYGNVFLCVSAILYCELLKLVDLLGVLQDWNADLHAKAFMMYMFYLTVRFVCIIRRTYEPKRSNPAVFVLVSVLVER